jgi:hypothetical protein
MYLKIGTTLRVEHDDKPSRSIKGLNLLHELLFSCQEGNVVCVFSLGHYRYGYTHRLSARLLQHSYLLRSTYRTTNRLSNKNFRNGKHAYRVYTSRIFIRYRKLRKTN